MAFPIRGLPPDVVDKLDIAAAQRGVSRNSYVIEVLTDHARLLRPTVTAESFAEALALASDLGDEELMRSAWSS
ncbi:MAG: type II toxin-antitoxin system VapB family antitoxin [Pseudonocardia sp.]